MPLTDYFYVQRGVGVYYICSTEQTFIHKALLSSVAATQVFFLEEKDTSQTMTREVNDL